VAFETNCRIDPVPLVATLTNKYASRFPNQGRFPLCRAGKWDQLTQSAARAFPGGGFECIRSALDIGSDRLGDALGNFSECLTGRNQDRSGAREAYRSGASAAPRASVGPGRRRLRTRPSTRASVNGEDHRPDRAAGWAAIARRLVGRRAISMGCVLDQNSAGR
jgi:hypothetical protein